jgi:hypothetical protein
MRLHFSERGNMAQMVPFVGLVDFYINALQTALGRTLRQKGPQQAASLQLLRKAIMQGHHQGIRQVLDALSPQTDLSPDQLNLIFAGISKLAALTPDLLTDVVDSDTLDKSIDETYALGLLAEEIGQPDMAYNLFESAYHLASALQKPCLKVARKLRHLSNPDNVNQYHAAIWRFATELLRDCIMALRCGDTVPHTPRPANKDWLSALDAVELALNVYVDHIPLQQQLCDQFLHVLREAEGTPIEELVAIYPTQVDPRYLAPEMRRKFIAALAGAPLEGGDRVSRTAALELWAAAKGQTMLDDIRLKLLDRYHGRPNLSWHDLTLQHKNLLHAVPLQQSLVIDVDRTGEVILELTHEIAHALCLLGPIGWAITAFRVATHYCEILLDSVEENPEARRADGLVDLRGYPALIDIAEIQLAACYRSAVHEAVWTPWLEGVAQYVEMLANPKDDPNEILAVHEAVRSLIDCPLNPLAGESEEDFVQRYGDESSKRFEDFFAEALSRCSRLRHVGYLQENARREIYLFGYLLVRSIVARWEVTLGRRIEPIHAAKLLLNATRNGTHSIDWGLQRDPQDFSSHASHMFHEWIGTIAAIDRDSLGTFLESVASDARGHNYYWKDGRPRRVADHFDEAQAAIHSSWAAFEQACVGLASGAGLCHAGPAVVVTEVARDHQEVISQLFGHYLEMISLLPVGKDMARLVLFNDGRAMVCPRTYIGLEEPKEDNSLPRYSVRSFPLDGGATETDSVRRACGLLGTARLHVTRIIDLTGHAKSPNERPNVSYVCLFLGDKWHRVTLGDIQGSNRIGDEFIQALRRRALHPPFPNESETLRSPRTLAGRILETRKDSHYAELALRFDKDALSFTVALTAVARAFGSLDREVQDATSSTLTNARYRIDLADYLFSTGMGKINQNHPALRTPLAAVTFSTESLSGIKPFGVSHV